MTVQCPYCGAEMTCGALHSRGGVYFLPEGEKAPALYTEASLDRRGAVPLPPSPWSLSLTPEWPAAYTCYACQKIILPYG